MADEDPIEEPPGETPPAAPEPLKPTLGEYVDAPTSDDDFVEACWAEAQLLVDQLPGADKAPREIVHRCYLEAGSELYHRRNAPNGIAQFATPDAAPVRVARDPLVGVYPILRPWAGPVIA